MIFAAGLGTRLRPFTESHPKALFPLNGKTLLQYQIEKLSAAGIRNIIINVHHFAEQIANYLQANNNFGLHIELSDERGNLLETGGGLLHARHFFGAEPFIACNVDILSNIDIKNLIAAHKREDMATVVVSERETKRYLLFDKDHCMRGWTNTSTGEVRPESTAADTGELRRMAFSGMQVLNGDVFRYMDGMGERFSLIDFYVKNCTEHTIRAYIPKNYRMMDIGKTEAVHAAERFARLLE
ncbi:MAG TPA: mannose-1-phosphate guanyltransferase [Bacteroidales bacterium]|nr:mannose-1-phosphate guanyltransferase [Bacteroidales bacterium]